MNQQQFVSLPIQEQNNLVENDHSNAIFLNKEYTSGGVKKILGNSDEIIFSNQLGKSFVHYKNFPGIDVNALTHVENSYEVGSIDIQKMLEDISQLPDRRIITDQELKNLLSNTSDPEFRALFPELASGEYNIVTDVKNMGLDSNSTPKHVLLRNSTSTGLTRLDGAKVNELGYIMTISGEIQTDKLKFLLVRK